LQFFRVNLSFDHAIALAFSDNGKVSCSTSFQRLYEKVQFSTSTLAPFVNCLVERASHVLCASAVL
jgi:hypothetical protein